MNEWQDYHLTPKPFKFPPTTGALSLRVSSNLPTSWKLSFIAASDAPLPLPLPPASVVVVVVAPFVVVVVVVVVVVDVVVVVVVVVVVGGV